MDYLVQKHNFRKFIHRSNGSDAPTILNNTENVGKYTFYQYLQATVTRYIQSYSTRQGRIAKLKRYENNFVDSLPIMQAARTNTCKNHFHVQTMLFTKHSCYPWNRRIYPIYDDMQRAEITGIKCVRAQKTTQFNLTAEFLPRNK